VPELKFPSALRNGENLFLEFVDSNVSENDLAELFKGKGFNLLLNEFPTNKVRGILAKKQFPTSNVFEFGWVIYECGLDCMRTYERHVRIFASSIYIYVRHVEEWGGSWQGEYCHLMISDSIKSGDVNELKSLKIFIEWLCTFTVAANPINNYSLLVSWLLLKCRLDEMQEHFVRVVENHLKIRRGDQYLLVGDSYGFGVDDWFDLVEAIPDVAGLDRDLLWDLIYRSDLKEPD